MKTIVPLLILSLGILLSACEQEPAQSPTRGSLTVIVPESIQPVMKEEVDQFMSLYRQNGADVRMRVGTTEEAIAGFVRDTFRLTFVTRPLTDEERAEVRKSVDDLVEVKVWYDGIIAIVNLKNPVDKVTVEEIRSILSGAVGRWEKLPHATRMKGPISVVYQDSSDVSSFLRTRVLRGSAPSASFTRAASSLDVFRTVIANRQAIGFVGLDWVDSAHVPAKALEIAQTAADVDTSYETPPDAFGKFFSPHPGYIYLGDYPFKRTIYMYSKSSTGDIATGFGTFVANKEGQRIIHRRGLVPGTQPIRLR